MKKTLFFLLSFFLLALFWQETAVAQTGNTCGDPIWITSLPFSATDNTSNYGNNYTSSDKPTNAPGAVGNPSGSYLGGDDVVYAFTPSSNGTRDITVTNHGSWTGLFVFKGCPFSSTVGGHTDYSSATTLEVLSLPVQAGETYYIVISTYPSPQNTTYTLDVIDSTPICPGPTALSTTGTTTTTQAYVTWTQGGTESNWNVSWGPPGYTPGDTNQINAISTPTTTYQINGLTPGTAYHVYVQADCGTDLSSWVGPLSFSTTCVATNIPFTQDFESVTTPDIPICGRIETNVGASNGNGWYTSNVTSYGFSSNVLRHDYSSSGSPNLDDWYFTQGINLTAGELYQINFKYGSNSTYSEKLKVAFGTSPSSSAMTAPSNEIVDLTFSMPSGGGSDEAEAYFQVPLNGVYYIGFQIHSGPNQYNVYVDDIAIDLAPECPKSTGLTAYNIGATNAYLDWDTDTTSLDWDVFVVEQSVGTVPDATTTPTHSSIGSHPFQITGLQPNTTYEFYVRADCDMYVADWAGPFTFKTACDATGDFTEGFESYGTSVMPDCWSENIVSTTSSPYIYTSSSDTNTGNRALRLGNSGDANAELYAITPSLTALSAGTHRITFHAKSGGTGTSFELGTMSDPTDVTTFTNIQTIPVTTAHQKFSVNFTTATTDNFIAFKATYASTYQYVSLDDIVWEPIPSCLAPTALTTGAITSTTADITWTAGANENNWNISWGTPGYTPGDANEVGNNTASATSYQITSLTSNTNYDVYVQADCGAVDGTSNWTGPLSIVTPCVPGTIPFAEGFESGYTDQTAVGGCWSQESISGSGAWTANNSLTTYDRGPRTGSFSAYLRYNNTDWLFYALDLTGGTAYQLKFYAKQDATSGADIEAAYGTSNTAAAMTNVIVASSAVTNGAYQEFSGVFTPATSGTYYIGIKATLNFSPWYINLDDISVDLAPACPNSSGLTASNIGATEVDLDWDTDTTSLDWDVFVVEQSAGITPDATTTPTDPSVGSHPYHKTGLLPGTTYEFYVRADCDMYVADWAGPVIFTTLPANDNLCDATPITIGATSAGDAYSTIGATAETGETIGSCLSSYGSLETVWFNFVAPASGNVTVTTDIAGGTLNDTQLAVYEAPSDCTDLSTLGAQVGCDQDGGGAVGHNWRSIASMTGLTAGDTYYIQIDGYGSNTGTFGLEVHDNGFVYENGAWTPSDPNTTATASDNITVVNGTTSLTQNISLNNINILSGATLMVEKVLTIGGDITNDGDLVFVSTATGNGELAPVPATSIITGEATVENYMSDHRSYRMVSSPIFSTGSIHDNWQEGAISKTDNPNPGFGTHITGTLVDQLNGFDETATGIASLYYADETSQQFVAFPNTDVLGLEPGIGYLLFVRGDRSIDLTDPTDNASSATILRAKGTLAYGNGVMNFSTSNAGDFVMVGNPFPSAVDVNSVLANAGTTNINPLFYYVYDPTQGTYGSYVTVDLTSGTSTGTSAANQYLQSGQGAQFATAASGTSAIEIMESNKAPGQFTTTSATGNGLSAANMLSVQLLTAGNFQNGGPAHDSFGIIFGDGLDNNITLADARKPMNFYENLGIDNNGTYLSLERREMPQTGEVYKLYSTGYSYSDYTLKLKVDGLEDVTLYLDDHYTGTATLLEKGDNIYSFSVDANDALSIATDRFSIRTAQRLGVNENNVLAGIRLYPNPLSGDTFYINAPRLNGEQVSVSISDISGRSIFNSNLDCNSNTITVPMGENMSSGIYMVTLKHGGESQTYRLIKE